MDTVYLLTDGKPDTSKSLVLSEVADLNKQTISVVSFNLVHFSKNCERWRPNLVEPTEENCHDAVHWVSTLVANGNTCTLQALEVILFDKIY